MNEKTWKTNKDVISAMQEAVREDTGKDSIGYKEFHSLRKHNYSQIKDKFDKSFVLQNKKTGAIVEIRAVSSVMAARTIGWRPRHVKVLETIDVSKQSLEQNKEDLSEKGNKIADS